MGQNKLGAANMQHWLVLVGALDRQGTLARALTFVIVTFLIERRVEDCFRDYLDTQDFRLG